MTWAPTLIPPLGRRRPEALDRLAGHLGAAGAALGVLAGGVDVASGSSIGAWTGNKLHPVSLGLLTIALSAIALAGVILWHRPGGHEGDRRLATVLALLIPAGICFTTVGRLWYPPGVLLLGAVGLISAASTRHELAHALSGDHWRMALAVLLGGYYLFLGGDALPKPAGIIGIIGALAIWAACALKVRPRRLGLILLVAGSLPFAIATWWSVVTPLIALLLLSIGPQALATRQS